MPTYDLLCVRCGHEEKDVFYKTFEAYETSERTCACGKGTLERTINTCNIIGTSKTESGFKAQIVYRGPATIHTSTFISQGILTLKKVSRDPECN